MNYKKSNYIKISKKCDGYFIYSQLDSKQDIKVSEKDLLLFNNILEGIENGESTLRSELIRKKFLVDEGGENVDTIKLKGNKYIYDKETLDITIIPTMDCNFRCTYCYQVHENKYMKNDHFDNILKYLSKNLRYYKVLKIDWFGGEPLLSYKNIVEFMEQVKNLCKKNRVALISSMTTNGFLLSEQVINNLISARILNFQITLDGLSYTHNQQRPLKSGKGSFDKIFENLQKIRDNISSKRLRILIRLNLSRINLPYLDSYLNLMRKEFGQDNRFIFEIAKVSDWGGNEIEKIKDSLVDMMTTIDVNKKLAEYGLNRPEINTHFSQGIVCSACRVNGYIFDVDGSIKKCSIAIGSDDKFIDSINNIGYIDNQGNLDIDYEKESYWVNSRNRLDELCESCVLFPVCFGTGCRLQELSGNKDNCHWQQMMVNN